MSFVEWLLPDLVTRQSGKGLPSKGRNTLTGCKGSSPMGMFYNLKCSGHGVLGIAPGNFWVTVIIREAKSFVSFVFGSPSLAGRDLTDRTNGQKSSQSSDF